MSDREFKNNILSSQLLVSSRESVELVFEGGMVLTIKEDLDQLGSINANLCALTNDFSRVNEVLEELFVDRGQGTRARTHLGDTRSASRFLKDATLSDQENVTVREFLFEFTNKTSLDLMETLEVRDRDKDDDGVTTMTNVDILCGGELKTSEVSLEFGNVLFKVNDVLSDLEFKFVRDNSGRFQDLASSAHVVISTDSSELRLGSMLNHGLSAEKESSV